MIDGHCIGLLRRRLNIYFKKKWKWIKKNKFGLGGIIGIVVHVLYSEILVVISWFALTAWAWLGLAEMGRGLHYYNLCCSGPRPITPLFFVGGKVGISFSERLLKLLSGKNQHSCIFLSLLYWSTLQLNLYFETSEVNACNAKYMEILWLKLFTALIIKNKRIREWERER